MIVIDYGGLTYMIEAHMCGSANFLSMRMLTTNVTLGNFYLAVERLLMYQIPASWLWIQMDPSIDHRVTNQILRKRILRSQKSTEKMKHGSNIGRNSESQTVVR